MLRSTLGAMAVLITGLALATHSEPIQRVSFYQAQQYQTSARPSRSACGPTKGPWRQVAVSRDLLRRYPCGTRVRVTLNRAVNGVRSFEAVVWDTTNRRFAHTVDILVGNHEQASRYGVTTGTLARR